MKKNPCQKHHDSKRKMSSIPLFFVKFTCVYLLSVASFFILDIMLWSGIVAGGFTPIGFILFFITRAGLADLISNRFFGIQVSVSRNFKIDFLLAMLIFGVPLMSFIEVISNLFGVLIEIPRPQYASFMQFTLAMAFLYEFPRLILFLAIKRFMRRTLVHT